jgi:thioredoxin 1
MAQVRSLTSATFDRALATARAPVLVDFYASWCPPCRALAPVLELLACEFDGQIDFYKVNVDEEPELAGRFQVQSVPTLKLYVGEGVYEIPGFVPAAKLRTLLESVARAGSTIALERS